MHLFKHKDLLVGLFIPGKTKQEIALPAIITQVLGIQAEVSKVTKHSTDIKHEHRAPLQLPEFGYPALLFYKPSVLQTLQIIFQLSTGLLQ